MCVSVSVSVCVCVSAYIVRNSIDEIVPSFGRVRNFVTLFQNSKSFTHLFEDLSRNPSLDTSEETVVTCGEGLLSGRVHKITKSNYQLHRVCPPGITRLPPDGFSRNLIFEYFSKICRENSSFVKNPIIIITGTLHEYRYTFLIISRLVLFGMRSVLEKVV